MRYCDASALIYYGSLNFPGAVINLRVVSIRTIERVICVSSAWPACAQELLDQANSGKEVTAEHTD